MAIIVGQELDFGLEETPEDVREVFVLVQKRVFVNSSDAPSLVKEAVGRCCAKVLQKGVPRRQDAGICGEVWEYAGVGRVRLGVAVGSALV